MKSDIASSRRILGMIHRDQKKWEESIDDFKESVKIFKDIEMESELAESHFEFGLMWKAKGDVDKAKEHLNKALDIFKRLELEHKEEDVMTALKALQM
jgi:tetratricopeptide (TPR) repeat protein